MGKHPFLFELFQPYKLLRYRPASHTGKSVARTMAPVIFFALLALQPVSGFAYTPIRSWIATGLVYYGGYPFPGGETAQWVAQHFDWFNGPGSNVIGAYTTAPMLVYDYYHACTVGSTGAAVNGVGISKDTEMQAWCGQSQNSSCVASGYPFACCTGKGTGTCTGYTYSAYSDPVTGNTYKNANDCHEGMYLHFNEATSVTMDMEYTSTNATYTLTGGSNSDCVGAGAPYSWCTGNGIQGSRVPNDYWTPTHTSSDTMMDQEGDVVDIYPNNPAFQAFNAWFQQQTLAVSSKINGYSDNGIFVDTGGTGSMTNAGYIFIVSGGTIAEYNEPFKTAAVAGSGNFDKGLVLVYQAAHNVGIDQWINNGNYSSDWTVVYPYITGIFREKMLDGYHTNSGTVGSLLSLDNQASNPNTLCTASGSPLSCCTGSATGTCKPLSSVIDTFDAWASSCSPSITPTCDPSDEMANLAMYYLVSSPTTYFSRGNFNYGGDPEQVHWFPAIEYNVGSPSGAAQIMQQGLDPSSPQQTSGTSCTISGGQITVPGNTWTTGQWAWDYFQDSNGNVFEINGNGYRNGVLGLYSPSSQNPRYPGNGAAPAGGPFKIATNAYTIYSRQFTGGPSGNVLVISKPNDARSSANNASTAISVTLPAGNYLELNCDGSTTPIPGNTIRLDDGQGAILINTGGSASNSSPATIPAINGLRIIQPSGGN